LKSEFFKISSRNQTQQRQKAQKVVKPKPEPNQQLKKARNPPLRSSRNQPLDLKKARKIVKLKLG
jgi:hypothetical protein